MEYEPLKRRINHYLKKVPGFRELFFLLLDALLLRQWYVKRAIRKYAPAKQNLNFYDAGSGFGQYSNFVLKHFSAARVLAVDVDKEILQTFHRYASKRYPGQVSALTADLQRYIPEEKQDLILLIDVLEHIEDDLAVLRNFRQVINNDGNLIISTPYASKEAKYTAEHFRNGYTREELERKLKETGWTVKELWFSYGLFGNIAWYLGMRIPLTAFKKVLIVVLPLYYLLTYPAILVLMVLDYGCRNRRGKGMVVVAECIAG